jgi:hypothetical protein
MTLAVKVGAATAGANATTALAPAAVTVPADGTVDEADVVRLVATVDTGTVVSFTATGGIRLVTALGAKAGEGSASAAIAVGTGTTATVYAYTTTTAAGSIVVSNQGVTNTIYMKGTAGAAHTILLGGPSALAGGTTGTYTVAAFDVFGNKVSGLSVNMTVAGATTLAGANTATVVTGTETATAGIGNAEFKVLAPAAGNVVVVANAAVTGVVAGLPAPMSTTSLSTGVVDLAAKVAGLEAALAAEKAARADDAVKAVAAATDAATKAAAAADAATKSIADLNAKIAVLTKNVADIKAKYNALAKKHKKPLIK